jgi:hypothetical protein
VEGSSNVIVEEMSNAGSSQPPRSRAATGASSSGGPASQTAPSSAGHSDAGAGQVGSPGEPAATPTPPGPSISNTEAPSQIGAGAQPPAVPSPAEALAAAPEVAADPDPDPAPTSDEPTWLEIVLLGEDGQGVACERYVVVLPDGTPRTGFLDDDGRAHLDELVPGTCQVSFPDLDSEAWQSADA